MALNWQSPVLPTGYQYNPSDTSFLNTLYNFLIPLEASTLTQRETITLVPKGDGRKNPTIGIGFDLLAGGPPVQSEILTDLGFVIAVVNGNTTGGGQALIESGFLAQIKADITTATPASIADMNQVMAARNALYNTDVNFKNFVDAGAKAGVAQRSSFAFLNDAEVFKAFSNLWTTVYLPQVYGKYAFLRTDTAFAQSREAQVLASLVWNGGPRLLGKDLGNALQTGNRAEAWFQIRDNSNVTRIPAVATRRFYESQVFGIFDSPNSPTYGEAVQAYQVLTQHRERIFETETYLGTDPDGPDPMAPAGQIEAANSIYGLSGTGAVQTLAQAFAPAEALLISNLSATQPLLSGLTTDFAKSTDILFASSGAQTIDAGNSGGGSADPLAGGSVNHIIFGSESGDHLNGGFGNDILIAGFGNETLRAGLGHDTLIGGTGSDTIVANGLNDKIDFEFAPGTHYKESIVDAVLGQDSLYVDGVQIGTGLTLQTDGTWKDAAGRQYQFVSMSDAYKNHIPVPAEFAGANSDQYVGELRITGGSDIGQNEVDLWGFNLRTASNQGFDGINIPKAIVLTPASSVFDILGAAASGTSPATSMNLVAGKSAAFTATLLSPGTSSQTITFTLSGGNTSGFSLDYNGQLLPFVNGAVVIPVDAKTTSVTASLVNTVRIGSAETLQLTATASDPATSTPLTVNYSIPTQDPFGDPSQGTLYSYGQVGNGTNFTYTSYGTAPSDTVAGAVSGGNNYIQVIGAPNDSIAGGSGNDTVFANFGGRETSGGTDVITGAGGQDILWVSNDQYNPDGTGPASVRVYANSAASLADAIAAANSATATHQQGDLIVSAVATATLVGGNGNDLFISSGDDEIVAGPGDETIFGGVAAFFNSDSPLNTYPDDLVPGSTWSTTFVDNVLTLSGVGFAGDSNAPPSNYEGNISDLGEVPWAANDTIHGGSGDDVILLSNGRNDVELGSGDATVFGGMGDNTIIGGGGDDYVIGGGGNDYIEAGSGDSFIAGRGGNNTIIGGAGADTLSAGGKDSDWATKETGDNYVQAGDGNTVIFGSGGSDTLIGGAGNNTIQGGGGNEYIVGGTGDESINGGNGNDTLIAGGSGADTIWAGTGATTIFGGGGTDEIHGSSGTDLIYAGDGGTSDSPTRIFAGSGATTIYGGAGVDSIVGGSGSTAIYAGSGGSASDPSQIFAGSGDTTVYGGSGYAQIAGGSGTDVLYAGDGGTDANPNFVFAGTGLATLYGGAGASVLTDNDGGSDLLVAGSGNTDLFGIGNDTLVAGGGIDRLSGSGNNTYDFSDATGDIEVVNAGGSDTLKFSSDDDISDITVGAELDSNGSASLVLDDGSATVTIDAGLSTANVVGVSYGGAAAASLTVAIQQAAAAGNALDTVVGGNSGSLYFDTGTGDVVTADDGRDTISAWGDNDTLIAGSGGDIIYAKGANDSVLGGSGADTLQADGNNTTLSGGTGNETFVVNNASTVVQAQAGATGGTVLSSVDFTLVQNVDVLTLTGTADLHATGNDDDRNTITGNSGNDTLEAGTGNDTLVSGTGVDTLIVGFGTDVVYVNNSDDAIETPYGTQYQDTVYSSVSYDLTAQVGNLILTGSDDLSAKDDFGYANIVGNSGHDTLTAGTGADTLVSGSGASTLVAGSGFNTLVINNVDDVIQATSLSRNVTVQSSVSLTLGQYLETLNLIGSADLVAQGNDETSNTISGNSGNDTLIAGSGADTLIAGSGIDLLVAGSGADVLQGQNGDTYELDSGFGNAKIETATGAGVLRFGSGISAADITVGIAVDDNGAAALTLSDGSGTATVSGGFSGSISSFQFANGDNLSLSQLLQVAHVASDSVQGAGGAAILDVEDGVSIEGGFGNDTIVAVGSNDTLAAGAGNQDLIAFGNNDVLTGGVGDDSLLGVGQNDVLATGTGNTEIRVGGAPATYSVTQGGTATIDASTATGVQTVLLPDGTTSADFTSFSDLNGDLVLQSLDGATTLVIDGFYSTQSLWLLKDANGNIQSLDNWAGGPHNGASSYRAEIDLLRKEFAASLPATMNAIGLRAASLDEPGQVVTADSYHFGGVAVQNLMVSGGSLNLSSSDTQDFEAQTTTTGFITKTYQEPIYSERNYPGTFYDIPVGSPGLARALETASDEGIPLNPITDSAGNVTAYRFVQLPQTLYQQTGTRTVTETDPIQSTYTTYSESFTDYNIVGDGGDDTITADRQFAGTVQTGDGNVNVSLAPYFGSFKSNHIYYFAGDPLPVGAFVEAGDGNDNIFGSGGADILAAGYGFDTLEGALGTQFYVPLAGDATDVIYASEAYYGNGPFPHNTLVLPNGISPSDLTYKLFADPDQTYGVNSQILQISYGDSNVLVYFDSGAPNSAHGGQPYLTNTAPDDTDGINRFQFADGTVLTRAQVLLLAGAVQSTDTHVPQAVVNVPEVTANTATQAGDWFSGTSTGGGHVTWYEITNSADSGGFFMLDGKVQTAGRAFDVSKDQLGELVYFAGAADSTDEIQVSAFDGLVWGDMTTADIHAEAGGNTFQATGANQTVTGSSTGPDTLVGGFGGDTLVGASNADTFEYQLGSGAEVISETAPLSNSSDNIVQFGAGITPSSITLGMQSGALVLDLGNGDSVSIMGFNPYDPVGSLKV